MKLKLFGLLLILLNLIFLDTTLSKQNSYNNNILSTWLKYSITKDEFEEYALKYYFKYDSIKANKSKISLRRDILEDLINLKLTRHIADSLQLDTLKSMQEAYNRKLYKISYNMHLFADSVQNKVVNDSMVRQEYSKMKYEYNISHILLSNKLKMNMIYDSLLIKPNSFSTLSKSNSEDSISAKRSGNLGWSILGNFIPLFSDQVLKLGIGEFSKPFKTKFGWHIALLNDIRDNISLGNYKKEKNKIKKHLFRQNKEKFNKIRNDFRKFLYQKYYVHIDYSNIRNFVDKFNDLRTQNSKNIFDNNQYRTSLIISIFDIDTLYVSDALYTLDHVDKSNFPDISYETIHEYIFYTYIFKLRELISDDLGYSKRPEIIKKAKLGMLSDYKEYLIQHFRGERKQEIQWFKPYHRQYNVLTNDFLLEETFNYFYDSKK